MVGRILLLALIAMALGCEAALVPAKEEIVMLFEINMLCPFIAIATFISIVVIQFVYAQNSPTSYTVTASPRTIHWGHLSSELKPVCTIDSGDIVTIETFGSCSPVEYEAAGIAPDLIPQALRDIFGEIKDRGPGVHILTGPIYIKWGRSVLGPQASMGEIWTIRNLFLGQSSTFQFMSKGHFFLLEMGMLLKEMGRWIQLHLKQP